MNTHTDKVIVDYMCRPPQAEQKKANFIMDCQDMMQQLPNCHLEFKHRECNWLVDAL